MDRETDPRLRARQPSSEFNQQPTYKRSGAMRKPEPVKTTTFLCGDYEGEGEIQAEVYEGELGLHTLEPGNPDPLSSLFLPAVDAAILAERIMAVAREAATEEKPSA
jgi:hypothetical protein